MRDFGLLKRVQPRHRLADDESEALVTCIEVAALTAQSPEPMPPRLHDDERPT